MGRKTEHEITRRQNYIYEFYYKWNVLAGPSNSPTIPAASRIGASIVLSLQAAENYEKSARGGHQ